MQKPSSGNKNTAHNLNLGKAQDVEPWPDVRSLEAHEHGLMTWFLRLAL